MNKITIKNIKFTSCMKVFFVLSICFGITIGVLGLIIGIFDGPVYAKIGANVYTGLSGGFLFFIGFPLISVLLGMIFGLIIYWPFKLFMKIRKGLSLYIEIENYDKL
ncbi:hypothetical protein V6615_07880 [Oscillospiraceae bacterium PP1C4]